MTAQQSLRLRPELAAVPSYRPGVAPPPRADGRSFKLSSNELPLPPLPEVERAMAAALRDVNRYPPAGGAPLAQAIGGHLDVPAEHVVVGCGAIGLLLNLLQCVAGPGDEVIYPWRSFEAYPIYVRLCGAESVAVPLRRDGSHDLAGMLSAINERSRAVLLCSPNNPTGAVIDPTELGSFLHDVPADLMVVLDEAYVEFLGPEAEAASIDLYRRHPNLVLLRTFSKAYALAGARVGFAVAHDQAADALRKATDVFAVSSIAQAGAIAALWLEALQEMRNRVVDIVSARDALQAELTAVGMTVPRSGGNFVWLPLGDQADAFGAALTAEGVSARVFSGEGVRITVGTPEAHRLVIEVARGALVSL